MSDASESGMMGPEFERLLSDALRPIEPPERLSGRVEDTLAAVTAAAAEELSDWAEELSESELRALRDPRNWVRPGDRGRRRRGRHRCPRPARDAPPRPPADQGRPALDRRPRPALAGAQALRDGLRAPI